MVDLQFRSAISLDKRVTIPKTSTNGSCMPCQDALALKQLCNYSNLFFIAIIVFIAKFFKRISMIDSTTIELAVIVGAPIATAIIVIIKYILHQGNKLNTTVTRTTALEKHDEEFAKKLKEEIEKAYLIHVKQFESTHAIEVSIAAIKARLG